MICHISQVIWRALNIKMQMHYHTMDETYYSFTFYLKCCGHFGEVSLHVIQNLTTWATVNYTVYNTKFGSKVKVNH